MWYYAYMMNATHKGAEQMTKANPILDYINRTYGTPQPVATSEPWATDRQISYLRSLVRRDPGLAQTVGASRDGVRVNTNLTKSEASRLIENMLNA